MRIPTLGTFTRLWRTRPRWGKQEGDFYARCQGKTCLFFGPHQDDEFLTLGVALTQLNYLDPEAKNVAVLLTDGSGSFVMKALNNGNECDWHTGKHEYKVTAEEFTEIRDQEYLASCQAMGLQRDNIHIHSPRAVDTAVTLQQARDTILAYVTQHPGAPVCAIAPSPEGKALPVQISDHRMLGTAAIELFEEGRIKDLFLFVEPYCLDSFRIMNPQTKLSRLFPSPEAKQSLGSTLKAYADWDPSHNKFGVGYHSVRAFMDAFIAAPAGYFYQYQSKREVR